MNKLLWVRTYVHSFRRHMCTPPSNPKPFVEGRSLAPKYKPSEFQKFILVWTKKYKSKAEVPQYVTPDLIEKSQSQARIKIANIFMLLTALASFGAILAGKAAAKRGESVHQMNLDWHKTYNDNYEKDQKK